MDIFKEMTGIDIGNMQENQAKKKDVDAAEMKRRNEALA